ncbi:MAG: ABC transporter permease subunit [Chloroflexota bacterium]|jgi:ABC-2 type transport system permease protein|tara:strand:+ start:22028 stop:22822 length:795 start_codon:yes stop_codon:yes gene_type:complete
MKFVFLATLRGSKVSIPVLCFAALLFSFVFLATFDAFGDMFFEMIETMPQGFRALIKASGEYASEEMGYLAVGFREPIYLIIILSFVIASSSSAIAKEIERGTIFLLLSRPVSREEFFLAKLATTFIGTVLLLCFAILGTWLGSLVFGVNGIDYDLVFKIQINVFFLSLAVAGIGYLISSILSEGGKTLALSSGVTVLMFFIEFLADSLPSIDWIGYVSVFHYYEPSILVNSESLSWGNLSVLIIVGFIGLILATIMFKRRDIP